MTITRTTGICLLLLVITFGGCGSGRDSSSSFASSTSWGAQKFVAASRDAALAALQERNNGKAKDLAQQGRDYAERCLMTAPEEPGCYYWRAVNTGVYYRLHVLGYQTGVKQMIADCEKVIELDPRYDHGGAYRILGQLYTQLPQTGGRPDSITRDLSKAEEALRKAVQLSPDYPENHLALAETLVAQEKFSEALASLTQARDLAPRWKHDVSYNDWRTDSLALQKKIDKAGN